MFFGLVAEADKRFLGYTPARLLISCQLWKTVPYATSAERREALAVS